MCVCVHVCVCCVCTCVYACVSACLSDNRHIRVFLTYTNDNKQHMKNVLRVCECLKKNNFSVGLDARESHLLREDGEKTRWHDMRYDKVACFLHMLSDIFRSTLRQG